MATERHASLPSTSHEDDALFLDILHEAPLLGNRKSRSIFGSIFYCFFLVGYAVLAVGAPWIFRPIKSLVSPLLCSCSVALLLVTGIFQQYLVYQVQKIRLQVNNCGVMGLREKLGGQLRWTPSLTVYGEVATPLSLQVPLGVRLWKNIRIGCDTFLGFSTFKVGDEAETKFWHDMWCGDTALTEAFLVLFGIARAKDAFVAANLELLGAISGA